ncbi:MAG TPA: hypothetical protein VF164_09270 [Trueperaceae bacterium]
MIVVIAAALGMVLTGAFVKLATVYGWGKPVRGSGPQSHLVKAGTPTMGGVSFLLAASAVALLMGGASVGTLALVALTLAAAAVGLYDDLISLARKRRRLEGIEDAVDESTGLLARYRLLGHFVIGLAFAWWAVSAGYRVTDLAWLDVLLYAFAIAGSINGFNFTDGLDGLAAGVTAIVLLFFLGSPFAAALLGALLAFLWYNGHPARVFMGGVGSEALGAAIAGLAILDGTVLLLPLVALIPVLEVVTVILQVAYFKATGGKRLFRMTPIHHHFELAGLSELQVTMRFWIVTAVGVAAALALAGRAPW